jgi:hypothetical protein
MKRSPFLFVLAAFVLLMASCKSGGKTGLFIPKNAAFVLQVSPSSLSSKLSWDEIKKTQWFQDLSKENNDSFAAKILDNPEAAGMDMKKDFAFFMKKQGRGGYGVFEGSIKDAAAFEALNKKISKKDKAEKDGEWSMITMDNNSLVAWNKERFAYINDLPEANTSGSFGMTGGGEQQQNTISEDSLKIFLKQTLTLDGDESLDDDDRFTSLIKESGDMHFWVNTGEFMGGMAPMMSMMKVGTLFEGNISTGTLNFDEGKILVKANQYYGKEMSKLMEKFDSKSISESVINRIPSQNVIGVMATNINPETLKEFLKALGMDGLMNMMFAQQEFTMDDIFTATKGEFVMALTDMSVKKVIDTVPNYDEEGAAPRIVNTTRPDFHFLFATSVNKKASFDKLLNVLNQKMPTLPFSYKLNNDWFAAGNYPESVDGFMAGGNSKQAFANKISGHPFGMYIDIQKILKSNLTQDSMASAFITESANMWQDAVATGGEYKNGSMTSEFVINLVDKKTNSLKQISQYAERMNAIKKQNMARMMTDMDNSNDSVNGKVSAAPPAVDIPN